MSNEYAWTKDPLVGELIEQADWDEANTVATTERTVRGLGTSTYWFGWTIEAAEVQNFRDYVDDLVNYGGVAFEYADDPLSTDEVSIDTMTFGTIDSGRVFQHNFDDWTADDSVGAHDGTVRNSPAYGSYRHGRAYTLNDPSDADQAIDGTTSLGLAAPYSFVTFLELGTLAQPSNAIAFSIGHSGTSVAILRITAATGNWEAEIYDGAGDSVGSITGASITTNAVCVGFVDAGDTVYLYVDGVEYSAALSSATRAGGGNQWCYGGLYNDYTSLNPLQMTLAEGRLYNRQLTQAEFQTLTKYFKETYMQARHLIEVRQIIDDARNEARCFGCGTTCSTNCGTDCRSDCTSGCATDCIASCYTGCDTKCTTTCDTSCYTACDDTCYSTCHGYCTDGCFDTCKDGCIAGCSGGCGDACNVGCEASCTITCAGDCSGDCGFICIFHCQGGCGGTCSDSCSATCGDADCWDTCRNSCYETCVQWCTGRCDHTCDGGCSASCNDTCATSCDSECAASCSSTCGNDCSTGCGWGTCTATCNADCDTTCQTSCYDTCDVSCLSGCSNSARIGPDAGSL